MAEVPIVDTNALACTYASLILHDDGQGMTTDGISKILKAAQIDMPAFWPAMYAKALGGVDVGELLDSVSNVAPAPAGGAAEAAAPAAGGAAPAPAAAAKAKEPEPEEEEDSGFSLFD